MADKNSTIPRGWKMTTLGEVVDIKGGKRLPMGKSLVVQKTSHPYIRITDIENNKIKKNQLQFITDDVFSSISRYIVNSGDVIVSIVGSIGFVAIIDDDLDKASLTENCVKFVNLKNLDSKFLYYFLTSGSGQNEIERNTIGAVQKKLPIYGVQNIKIFLPSFPEQRAIAAVLSSLDDKIELLREQNKTLEAIAQAIFKEWFVNFNFPGATGKMIDSELGEIPEGWRVGGLIEDSISEFVKTNIDKFDGTKDYVETANVNLSNFVGNFEKITYEERASRANMQPVANSIWFARMAESRKYLLFQERDWQNIETKILSTGFAGIRCIKDYLYFYWCFILSNTFNNLKNQFAEGAVQVAISNEGIQRILLALPPKEIVQKFTETVSSCFEKISNNNSQIQTLSALRDTLLPKLMKGEVRVKGFKD